MAHHRNRLRSPRCLRFSSSGSAAIDGDQMMPSSFSGAGGRVNNDTTIIAMTDAIQTTKVRFNQLSKGFKNNTCLNNTYSTNAVKGKPNQSTNVAAAAVARRQSTPTKKTAAIGAATQAPIF